MLVKDRMTSNPITIPPETPIPEALRLMKERNIRRLPVVDRRDNLVGIVSDSDLLYASPSPATTLSVWEIPELLAKIKVEQVMTKKVITVGHDIPLEEAARIMRENHVSGLPVMQNGKLVGIITESDLFEALLDSLGGRRSGIRISVSIPNAKGTLAKIADAICDIGGDIVGLGVSELTSFTDAKWELTLKVQDISKEKLVNTLTPIVTTILDVRVMD